MKIGIFGNTNNLPYLLSEELRRQGVDVKLLVNSTSALHRPENLNKSFTKKYPAWIHDVSEISQAEVICETLSLKKIFHLLEDVDAVILNHIGPSLSEHFSDKKRMAFLTGSDLDYYGNMQTVERRASQWSERFNNTRAAKFELQVWKDFIGRQRSGIRNADVISYFPKGFMPSSDKLLEEIGVTDDQRMSNYFATHTQGFIPPKSKSRLKIFSCMHSMFKEVYYLAVWCRRL